MEILEQIKQKDEFIKMIEKCIKPLVCICGIKYPKLKGGFVSDGSIYLWCCSKNCATKTQNKLY